MIRLSGYVREMWVDLFFDPVHVPVPVPVPDLHCGRTTCGDSCTGTGTGTCTGYLKWAPIRLATIMLPWAVMCGLPEKRLHMLTSKCGATVMKPLEAAASAW